MRRAGRWIGLVAAVLAVAVLAALLPSGVRNLFERPAAPEPAAAPSPAAPSPDRRPDWFLPSLVVHGPLATDRRNFADRTRAGGPLLLFLPATGEAPADYTSFLHLAVRSGYHVLGLDYWNLGRSVASTCGTDARCYGAVQRNRFDGSHPFDRSRVAPRDSVLGRLRPALAYLHRRDPHGGWDRYLVHGGVRWSDVVLAGHSQGGGESAYIAHVRAVHGALLFGSPIVTDGRTAATWLASPGRTPASRIWAFDSTSDVFWPRIEGSWRLLGLGEPCPIDRPQSAWGHALIDTAPEPHAHARTLQDRHDLPGHRSEHEQVQRWMLQRFAPTASSAAQA